MGELEVWKAGHDEGTPIETGAGWTKIETGAGWTMIETGAGWTMVETGARWTMIETGAGWTMIESCAGCTVTGTALGAVYSRVHVSSKSSFTTNLVISHTPVLMSGLNGSTYCSFACR
jgi:hypothetical protein